MPLQISLPYNARFNHYFCNSKQRYIAHLVTRSREYTQNLSGIGRINLRSVKLLVPHTPRDIFAKIRDDRRNFTFPSLKYRRYK